MALESIFSPFVLNNLHLKNRLVRSATTSYYSDSLGKITDPIIKYYEKLAKGGVGLIIKGHSYISEKAKAHRGQSGLCNRRHLDGMKRLTKVVHHYDVPIIAQLNHGGYTCKADRVTASNYITPSWTARELSVHEIQDITEQFTHAAELAIQAGFDGIQIHAAHGYLLSQFLSDIVNKRTDQYGGSIENRARFLLEVYDSIRKAVGPNFVVGVKINCDDFAEENGLTLEDSIKVMQLLEARGIDFIEISGGGPQQTAAVRKNRGRAPKGSGIEEATFGGHAMKIRKKVNKTPLALVDGIRSVQTMENLIENDIVDLVSMSKPFIIEPDFPTRLKNGQQKSSCTNCNLCLSKEVFGKKMLECQYLNIQNF